MNNYKRDFVTNNNFVYLNSASTSYIAKGVLDEINNYYLNMGGNAGRGIDSLGFLVTKKIENSREKVAKFLNASVSEIIFTRGTTESLNLVASSFGNLIIKENDEIIISIAEHHSNFVPWQEIVKKNKAKLIVIGLDKDNKIDLNELKNKLNYRTKIVAINHVSNVLGSINDLKKISTLVHDNGSYLVVDGAQGILQENIDVKYLDVDFYTFSFHKIYGSKGVGVLFGKKDLLNIMPPMTFGGEMVDIVTKEKTTYKEIPYKFEAGTLMIPEIISVSKTIDYITGIGLDKINQHISTLRNYTLDKMKDKYSNIIYYNDSYDSKLITFNIKGIHSHDVATVLDKHNIIVRAGHHCCEPLMNYLNIPSTIRISFGLYNTLEDCDKFIEALGKVGDYLDVLLK